MAHREGTAAVIALPSAHNRREEFEYLHYRVVLLALGVWRNVVSIIAFVSLPQCHYCVFTIGNV